MVGQELRHQECNTSYVSGMAREIPPGEGGQDGTSLNVGKDIVGEKTENSGLGPHDVREVVRVNLLGWVFELHYSPPDVVQDMSSRTECAKLNSNYGGPIVPAFKRRDVSTMGRDTPRLEIPLPKDKMD